MGGGGGGGVCGKGEGGEWEGMGGWASLGEQTLFPGPIQLSAPLKEE